MAYGAAAVYCGLALEAFLYERTKRVLPSGWGVEALLNTAVREGVISDVPPGPNQISQREASSYILTVRDVHAHHVAGLRARTSGRYLQVQSDWGSSTPAWFNELEGAAGLDQTLNTLEPYKRTMALQMM